MSELSNQAPEWRQANSVCLIDLKTIIKYSDRDDYYVHSLDDGEGNNPRFAIKGKDIETLAKAFGVETYPWLESFYNHEKQKEQACSSRLAYNYFYMDEIFNHYPHSKYGVLLKSIKVKDFQGHLEIQIDLKAGDCDEAWTEHISYSGNYSIVWEVTDSTES